MAAISQATGAWEAGGNLDALVSAIGAVGNTAVVDPTQSASVIAALKGLLEPNSDNITLLASGVVTANANSADQTNYRARGIKLFIATGSFGASESAMTVTIQGKDPVSGTYYTILTSASLTASSFTVLSVYPGLAVTANVSANDVLPRTFRVTYQATNWGTGGSTLGIACAMIV